MVEWMGVGGESGRRMLLDRMVGMDLMKGRWRGLSEAQFHQS